MERTVLIECFLGKTFINVFKKSIDTIVFIENGGTKFIMTKDKWGERGSIDDIIGDLKDLIGSPILMAEEATDGHLQPKELQSGGGFHIVGEGKVRWQDSYTWAFYKLATIKGYVTVRWYGYSNGFYCEKAKIYKETVE